MNDSPPLNTESNATLAAPWHRRLPGLWFPFVCLLLYWGATLVAARVDKLYFVGFLVGIATTAILTLLWLGWWLLNRAMRWWEKVLGLVLIITEAGVVGHFADPSITGFTLWAAGFPLVATAVVVWLFLAGRFRIRQVRTGWIAVVTLTWCYFLVIRFDGADSHLTMKRHWRWTPTAEETFLAGAGQKAGTPETSTNKAARLAEASGDDWVEFRGTNRDGVIRSGPIATDWSTQPPRQVWRRSVGPAWSSVIVVGNRLFTQEQRGEKETVDCYDAATGEPVWTHEDTTRFEEAVSGPGPRATPTYSKRRTFSLGGTGLLNCLEAETGKVIWSRDIKEASGAAVPMWAFSSSPLVAGDLVIVYAGGKNGKGLLAYRSQSGEVAWSAEAGESSYSSPQLTTLCGVPQCLMLQDAGLSAFDVSTGRKLWETGVPMKGAPRCGQPRLVDGDRLLVASLGGLGCSLLKITHEGDRWSPSTLWESRALKPEFPDFVVHKGHVYGFDVGMFCCLNVDDGKRDWKDGRYGRGQVMVLQDQNLLLVSSETGDLVLLAADPAEHREIGRFKALEGKTWNHPVLVGDRIYHRNAEEMVCYSLSSDPGRLSRN